MLQAAKNPTKASRRLRRMTLHSSVGCIGPAGLPFWNLGHIGSGRLLELPMPPHPPPKTFGGGQGGVGGGGGGPGFGFVETIATRWTERAGIVLHHVC